MGLSASRCARTHVRGLLVGTLLALVTPLVPAPAAALPTTASAASVPVVGASAPVGSPENATTPLRVELDDIAPAVLPRRGTLTVSGSVTNADEETWTQINVYSFLDDDPIDDPAELAEQSAAGEDEPVGDRITAEGTEARIDSLEPGETSSFSLTVPSALVMARLTRTRAVAEPGVYWFGVHALGASSLPRDGFTDGRARTFVPLLPRRVPSPVPTSVVVPLRAPVAYEPDGSLANLVGWSRRLALGGRLRDRVDFGAASDSLPVSWLVDPGLVEAVARLAAGNPGRSLAATQDPDGEDLEEPADGDDGSATASEGALPTPSALPDPDADTAAQSEEPGSSTPGGEVDPATAEAAERALAWLDRLTTAVPGDEVLALPYGDVDVSGALEHDPALYDAARSRPSPALRQLTASPGTRSTPVVAPPNGLIDPTTVEGVDGPTLVLASDELVDGPAPTVAAVGDRTMVLASSGAAAGGPGPTETLSSLALRQRVVSEAALRLIDRDADAGTAPEPLVVVMPLGWRAESGATFFDGLRSNRGLRLSGLTSALGSVSPTVLDPADLIYPAREQVYELGELAFDAAATLVQGGETLQAVLSRNDRVAAAVAAEAYAGVAYTSRRDRRGARASLRSSRAWIDTRLSSVHIEAPPGVTLSGGSGTFSATLVNDLDEPVVVQVEGIADSGVTIPVSAPVELGPQGRSTVQIEALDVSPGVHNVSLRLVDPTGRALPSVDVVPLRSAQVSNVIWLIMGTGVALMFAAIAARTVRRIRAARAAPGARR